MHPGAGSGAMKGQLSGPIPPSLFPLLPCPGRYWSAPAGKGGKGALHGTGVQPDEAGGRLEMEMVMGQGRPKKGWSLKEKRKVQRGLHGGRLRQSWWST